jgi:N-acetylmuramoyl-L-alanine amidase
MDRNQKKVEEEKPKELPLKNDFRILLMSTPTKYSEDAPALKGLKYILTVKKTDFINIITVLQTSHL